MLICVCLFVTATKSIGCSTCLREYSFKVTFLCSFLDKTPTDIIFRPDIPPVNSNSDIWHQQVRLVNLNRNLFSLMPAHYERREHDSRSLLPSYPPSLPPIYDYVHFAYQTRSAGIFRKSTTMSTSDRHAIYSFEKESPKRNAHTYNNALARLVHRQSAREARDLGTYVEYHKPKVLEEYTYCFYNSSRLLVLSLSNKEWEYLLSYVNKDEKALFCRILTLNVSWHFFKVSKIFSLLNHPLEIFLLAF